MGKRKQRNIIIWLIILALVAFAYFFVQNKSAARSARLQTLADQWTTAANASERSQAVSELSQWEPQLTHKNGLMIYLDRSLAMDEEFEEEGDRLASRDDCSQYVGEFNAYIVLAAYYTNQGDTLRADEMADKSFAAYESFINGGCSRFYTVN